jgi:hypothetical protein
MLRLTNPFLRAPPRSGGDGSTADALEMGNSEHGLEVMFGLETSRETAQI